MESGKLVVDFARVQTFTCVIGVGSPAGARRGRGDHQPDPAPFPADDGTSSPPADDQHSQQWHTQNGRGVWGSTTAIGPRTTGRGITASPPPSDAAGRGRDGRVKRRAAAGSPAPWRTCQKADVQRDRGTRSPTGCWVSETTGPPSDGRMMAVGTFDVCSNAAVNSDLSCFLYTSTSTRPR